jgi:hypothetical protein
MVSIFICAISQRNPETQDKEEIIFTLLEQAKQAMKGLKKLYFYNVYDINDFVVFILWQNLFSRHFYVKDTNKALKHLITFYMLCVKIRYNPTCIYLQRQVTINCM